MNVKKRNGLSSMGVGLAVSAAVLAGCSSQPESPPDPPVSLSDQVTQKAITTYGHTVVPVIGGKATKVTVVNTETGQPVLDAGSVRADGAAVVDNSRLEYSSSYSIRVVPEAAEGYSTPDRPLADNLRTITPRNQTRLRFNTPSRIGIGSLATARFDEPVKDREKAVRHLRVINETTGSQVSGAWRWTSDQDIEFRPDKFWDSDTSYHIATDLFGRSLAPGLFGQLNQTGPSFSTGDRWLVTINDNSKSMYVWHNRKIVKTIPVSLGKSGHETPNGVYVVGEKRPSMIMDSSTYGVKSGPEAYRLRVQWATQISYNGIYVHAAPWSVSEQGNTNTSHGCINVTDSAGEWFLDAVPVGTPVVVRNTDGSTLEATDGLGYWNQSPKEFSESNGL